MGPRIVLVGTKHSGNLGGVARAMKNFGLTELFLVAPRCRIDRQAHAMASHASDVLENASQVEEAQDALAGCSYVLGTTARSRASESFEVIEPREAITRLPAEGSAVVFGPEDTGLSNNDLDLCQAAVRIPTARYASLNLAQAVNVIGYEWHLTKRNSVAPPPDTSPAGTVATRDEFEPMIEQLMDTLEYIGYTQEPKSASVEHMFRRLLDRARPSSREIAALRGLWTQIRWAADQPPERLPGRRDSR